MANQAIRPVTETECTANCELTRNDPWGTHRPSPLQQALIWSARKTFLHRGKMRHRMTNFITRFHCPIDVEFRGCKYRIEGRNNLAEYGLLLNPAFNKPEIDFLLECLPVGGVAVDLGSNIGLYSLPLAKKCGPSGRVISIDANPGMVERLAENSRLSEMRQISPVCAAVGDHEGRIDLFIIKNDVAIVRVQESTEGSIPMHTLADILEKQGIDRIDVMKVDIEGCEDAALVPFFATASRQMMPRRIVIEGGGGPDGIYAGCRQSFIRNGYRLVGSTRSNHMFERAD
jgi:FkbM family methyltransferase